MCPRQKIQLGRGFVHHRISLTKKANRFKRLENTKGKAKDLNSGYKTKAEFFWGRNEVKPKARVKIEAASDPKIKLEARHIANDR